MSATTATQTPIVVSGDGDASSESSVVDNVVVVTKKSPVVSAEPVANGGNMSQKGIGEKVNGESGGGGGMKEKKINLKVRSSRPIDVSAKPNKSQLAPLVAVF